ncbi:MAG TPA: DNA-binding protein WhiA [Firmicutes bacterium]|nr:DNA-binding protein WhiA [Bacillota bacterium]
MSFSSKVKDELSRFRPANACCAAAEAYGLAECGHAFSPSAVSLQTENPVVAAVYREFLSQVCVLPGDAWQDDARSSGTHIVTLPQERHRLRVLERFGHAAGEVSLRLNRANLECEECPAAYLRGAFLACGTVTNPSADYHMEFSIPHYPLSRDLLALMQELGFRARLVRRKGSQVVYLKESEQIEDALTLMGATGASLELMNVKMVKDIRNAANRIANCENANIDKTVAASLAQVEAIRKITEKQGLDGLPEELRELARLRLENPEMSLRELGEQLSEPLSRSGVNHRLRRIMELADKLG